MNTDRSAATIQRIMLTISMLKQYRLYAVCVVSDLEASETFLSSYRVIKFNRKQRMDRIIFLLKLLKTKRNLLYIRNQSVPRSKHFPPRL